MSNVFSSDTKITKSTTKKRKSVKTEEVVETSNNVSDLY